MHDLSVFLSYKYYAGVILVLKPTVLYFFKYALPLLKSDHAQV